MTKKQIKEFIKYIDPEIKVEFATERMMREKKIESVAYALPYKWLVCFGNEITRWNRIVTLSVILHELGHIYTGVTKSDSKDELRAQLWAIRIAQLLKMHGLSEYLWREICTLYKTQPYKESRKYFMASKLAGRLPHPIKSHSVYEAIEYENGVSNPGWLDQLIEMVK